MEDFLFNHPLFQNMDPIKLNFMKQFANQSMPKNMNEAMPFLLANMNSAKNQNIRFSGPEVHLIAEILCRDLPASEQAKVKKILAMMNPK